MKLQYSGILQLALCLTVWGSEYTIDQVPEGRVDTIASPVVLKWSGGQEKIIQFYRGGEVILNQTSGTGSRREMADGPLEIKLWTPGNPAPDFARSVIIRTPSCSEVFMTGFSIANADTVASPLALRWDSLDRKRIVQVYRNDSLYLSQEAFSGLRLALPPGPAYLKIWIPGGAGALSEKTVFIDDRDWKPVTGNSAKGFDKYRISLDQSVGCTDYPACLNNVEGIIRYIGGAEKEVFELIANAKKTPGVFAGAIAHSDQIYSGEGIYKLSGKMRKVSGTDAEVIDVNVSRVEDSVEHFAEIFLGTNPGDPSKYLKVWTRSGLDGYIPLFQSVQSDTAWHWFRIVVEYTTCTKKAWRIRSIGFDERDTVLNLDMGSAKKSWKSHFKTLLETQSMYTNCDINNGFMAKSQWDSVSFRKLDSTSCALGVRSGLEGRNSGPRQSLRGRIWYPHAQNGIVGEPEVIDASGRKSHREP